MSIEQHIAQSGELAWVKSSYSGTNGGDCVEVATAPGTVRVRDSKAQTGAALAFPREQWAAFTIYVCETAV
ncbi:DUF397 domain-containing protein [Streptomyces griseoloalbus]|uniref:DUF397 domain-containing protein n=1 Tax=Streptomyces griseoloalbus TaxID=67303 RepID=A0A7W8BPE2_9ACTN|nr:DUF397 domain-containing protein [Streptomyces albaduncus]MBB5126368.1 hypothetical protein [Streptomyces albaduncus]GGW35487.1 hypothetical protein GCM10010340_11420 [Streptomyces albaduncus]